jgi:phospholipid/cholesterol/gamma-HCH transport system substrate-binding protein
VKRLLALAVLTLLPAASCSLVGGDSGQREMTAIFHRAVAFYPGSHVKLMGNDIGTVRAVDIDGDRIKVRFAIDDDIPLPADVHAGIVPLTLVGERNLVLYPAWRPGMPKLEGEAVIPPERTSVPVEPDDALKAFTDLVRAIDPKAVEKLAVGGTNILQGRGPLINETLDRLAQLTTLFASQDGRVVEVAQTLRRLVGTINSREAQLSGLIRNFTTVTGVLARERQSIVALLDGLARLPAEGEALLADLGKELPEQVATLVKLALVLQSNAAGVRGTVKGIADVMEGLLSAWDRHGYVNLRGNPSGSTAEMLQPLFDTLGLGKVPCLSVAGDMACPAATGSP